MDEVERELRDLGERAAREVSYHEVPARKIVRRARLRRGLTIALSTAAVVLVAAVAYPGLSLLTRDGGAERGPGDLAFVTAATEEAGSARVELTVEMTLDGRAATTRATGELDFGRIRSHLVVKDLTGSGRIEMISIGDRMFQRRLDGPDGGSSKWIAADVPGGGTAFGAGASPADFLANLESTAKDVTKVGEEELDGVPVTRYQAVIDPAAPDSSFRRLSGQSEIEVDPMDVWVDELGRLRKLTFASTIDGGFGETEMQMTMELSDFGIPVDIVAPDPEDVTDDAREFDAPFSGSRPTAGDSFSDFSADTFLVFGEDYLSEPFVTVNIDDTGTALLCAQAMPARAAHGVLLHEATGRRIATVGLHESGKKPTVACAPPGIAHEDVDALLREPSDYTLRIEMERGPDVVVRLTETGSPLDDASEE